MNETYNWYKSSYTAGQGNCVEVAAVPDGIAVRDSKNPAGPVLRFGVAAWQAFVNGVKAGTVGTLD
jgi:hypothetical protein